MLVLWPKDNSNQEGMDYARAGRVSMTAAAGENIRQRYWVLLLGNTLRLLRGSGRQHGMKGASTTWTRSEEDDGSDLCMTCDDNVGGIDATDDELSTKEAGRPLPLPGKGEASFESYHGDQIAVLGEEADPCSKEGKPLRRYHVVFRTVATTAVHTDGAL